jgi:galactose mutarotase-like enzyme
MFHYGLPPAIYHQHGVSQHADLRRYDKSPQPAQRSFSVNTRKGTNSAPFREDVTLILRQQPKEALVTTDGKEKGKQHSFCTVLLHSWSTDKQQRGNPLTHRPLFRSL